MNLHVILFASDTNEAQKTELATIFQVNIQAFENMEHVNGIQYRSFSTGTFICMAGLSIRKQILIRVSFSHPDELSENEAIQQKKKTSDVSNWLCFESFHSNILHSMRSRFSLSIIRMDKMGGKKPNKKRVREEIMEM